MTSRLGAALALVAVLVVGLTAYLAGGWAESRRLSPTQRAEVNDLVKATFDEAANQAIREAVGDFLRDNPDVLANAGVDGSAIRDYLVENPEVISEALVALERKRQEQESVAQEQAIKENREAIFNSDKQVVLGNPDGDITLVEFFDYNCGYCRQAHAHMEDLIQRDGKLRVVLKEFPVLGPGSVGAARVAIALWKVAPDKYAEFHREILSSREPTDEEKALAVATGLGADEAALRAALADRSVDAAIEESFDLASALGINGTPTYVLHTGILVGAVGPEALQAEIAAARAACQAESC